MASTSACILAAGADTPVADTVSQWAGDPVFRQQGPAARGILPLSDLLHLTGLDDRVEPGRPAAPAALRPLIDREGQPNVWVLAYQPEFSPERGLVVRGRRLRSGHGVLAVREARRRALSARLAAACCTSDR